MTSASRYIVELAAEGRHTFATEDAVAALGGSIPAVRAQLRRLKRDGQLATPHRGFYVIVPPEYRRLGCLPADQFVPQLMERLKETYYVALLSAAELHGAAHQRPQAFQVMLQRNRRAIACGQVRIQFVARRDLDRTPVALKNTPRGHLRVSSPEATALELVGYADQSGGLQNVLSVLGELVDVLDREKLIEVAHMSPIAWVQRLGYLLELVEHNELADSLAPYVREHAIAAAPLVRAKPVAGAPRIDRWKLVANSALESDP